MSSRLKKILAILAAVGVGSAALLFVFWNFWVPNSRPSISGGQSYGLDVSRHQGEIDWQAVAADDIDFAYIKATEGGDWSDDRFETNWQKAREAGIEVGAYHFFTLCTDGETQAEHFLKTVDQSQASLPPALDIELGGNCANPPGENQIALEVDKFIDTVEGETGEPVVLYVLEGFDFLDEETLARPRWVRSILREPESDNWFVWQYSGFAHVNGVEGDVDLNVFNQPASPD